MKQSLVLFTSTFPYGEGETFLETEIIYLCQAFKKVTIVSQNTNGLQTREVPSNCKVNRIDVDYSLKTRLSSILNIVHPLVRKELKIIKNIYLRKINSGILKTMLVSLERGKKVEKYILNHFKDEFNNTLFYSYWYDDMALGIALNCEKNKNFTGIARIHRWDIYFEESEVNYLPYRHFISENLKTTASISQDGIEYVIQNWKINADKVTLARLGINNNYEYQIKPERASLKLVSCSNLIPVKRVFLLVEALQLINEFDIEWTHFGDGVLLEELKQKITKLPKNITVHLPGRISNQKIYTLYHNLQPHLFINVSSSEGIPVSIMEALSFGIPVIATNVGGNSEIVNNKNGSLLSSNPTPEEISKQIEYFVKITDEEYQNYSKQAYETWFENYNAEKNYSKFTSFISNLK